MSGLGARSLRLRRHHLKCLCLFGNGIQIRWRIQRLLPPLLRSPKLNVTAIIQNPGLLDFSSLWVFTLKNNIFKSVVSLTTNNRFFKVCLEVINLRRILCF